MAKKKGKKSKTERHEALLKDYDKAKQDKLEKIADKMLKHDSKNQQLKNKNVNPKFLDLF
jgi:predicted  nucleic acid-binding Zn-ribbon protein